MHAYGGLNSICAVSTRSPIVSESTTSAFRQSPLTRETPILSPYGPVQQSPLVSPSPDVPVAAPRSSLTPSTETNTTPSTQLNTVKTKNHLLSRLVPKPTVPRFQPKKKTVAFGITTNMSQTIEGTSRVDKQMAQLQKSMPKLTLGEEKRLAEQEKEKMEKRLQCMEEQAAEMIEKLTAQDKKIEELEKEIQMHRTQELEKKLDTLNSIVKGLLLNSTSTDAKDNTVAVSRQERETERERRTNRKDRPEERARAGRETREDWRDDSEEEDPVDLLNEKNITLLKQEMRKDPALNASILRVIGGNDENRRNSPRERRRDSGALDRTKQDYGGLRDKETERKRYERGREPMRNDTNRRNMNRQPVVMEKMTIERSIRCSPSRLRRNGYDDFDDDIDPENVQSIYQAGQSRTYYDSTGGCVVEEYEDSYEAPSPPPPKALPRKTAPPPAGRRRPTLAEDSEGEMYVHQIEEELNRRR